MEEVEDFVPIVPDIPASQLAKTPKRIQETPKKVQEIQEIQNDKSKNPLDTLSAMSSPKVLMIIFAVIIVILIVVIVWLFIRKTDTHLQQSQIPRQLQQPQPQPTQPNQTQPNQQQQIPQQTQQQQPNQQQPQQNPQQNQPQPKHDVSELMKYAQLGLGDNTLVPQLETQNKLDEKIDENKTIPTTMEDAKMDVVQRSIQNEVEERYQQTLVDDTQPYETYIETSPITLAVNNAQQAMLTDTCMYVINHRTKTSTVCGKPTINGTQFCAKHQPK